MEYNKYNIAIRLVILAPLVRKFEMSMEKNEIVGWLFDANMFVGTLEYFFMEEDK